MNYREKLQNEFDDILVEYKSALRLTLARITNLKEMMELSSERSPFDSIDSRIKTFDSILEKCERRGYDAIIETIKEKIRDIAGIRIITPFRDDIYAVANMLEHIPGINIISKKDYVKEPKANGYRSLHLQVQIEVYSPANGSKLIPVEIQIRDKAMDLWATLEHIVKYKNDDPSPTVSERFKRVADVLSQFDNMAIDVRDFSSAESSTVE